MSRIWDTPEYWARWDADEMLRATEDLSPGALADSLEGAVSYDGDPATAAAIVAELRRRATAGVRFWPDPTLVAAPDADIAKLIDDEIPW